jgi:hypothetical protein
MIPSWLSHSSWLAKVQATWYSYLPPRFITSWSDLKNKLRQDFQGFRRGDSSAADNSQCLQHDKEPLYDYF